MNQSFLLYKLHDNWVKLILKWYVRYISKNNDVSKTTISMLQNINLIFSKEIPSIEIAVSEAKKFSPASCVWEKEGRNNNQQTDVFWLKMCHLILFSNGLFYPSILIFWKFNELLIILHLHET